MSKLESEQIAERLLERYKKGDLEVDFGGHYGFPSDSVPYADTMDNLLVFVFGYDSMGLDLSLSIMRDRTDRDVMEWVLEDPLEALRGTGARQNDKFYLGCGLNVQCGECEDKTRFLYDGKKVWADSQCSVSGGLKPWDLEIDVPSGKLVFRNDMRRLFDAHHDGGNPYEGTSVNLTAGRKKCEEYHAGLGLFHVFVGNTSPDVYLMPDGRVIVGHLYDVEEELVHPKYHVAEKIGFIVTDLWWFGACDLEDFIRRNGSPPGKIGWVPDVVVKMPQGPGRYRLRSSYSVTNGKDPEYAVISRA